MPGSSPGMTSSFPRRFAPEPCMPLSFENRGRRDAGARRARSLACKIKKHTSVVATGPPVSPSIPCAMVLTAYFALSPGTGLSCPRYPQEALLLENLTPASGRQDHTTSPSAPAPLVLRHHPHPSHPAPTSVTTRTPLLSRRDSASRKFDLPDGESEIFFAAGLDRKKSRAAQVICPSGKSLRTARSYDAYS